MNEKELRLQDVNFDFIDDVLNDLFMLNRELVKLNEIMSGDKFVEAAIGATRLLEYSLECVLYIKNNMIGDDE